MLKLVADRTERRDSCRRQLRNTTHRVGRPVIRGLVVAGFVFTCLGLGACGSLPQVTETPTITDLPVASPSAEELAAQGYQKPHIGRITAERLKQMMDNGEPVVVVDTRESFFYNIGHINGAVNLEYQSVNDAGLLSLPRDRQVVIYCD